MWQSPLVPVITTWEWFDVGVMGLLLLSSWMGWTSVAINTQVKTMYVYYFILKRIKSALLEYSVQSYKKIYVNMEKAKGKTVYCNI